MFRLPDQVSRELENEIRESVEMNTKQARMLNVAESFDREVKAREYDYKLIEKVRKVIEDDLNERSEISISDVETVVLYHDEFDTKEVRDLSFREGSDGTISIDLKMIGDTRNYFFLAELKSRKELRKKGNVGKYKVSFMYL